MQENQSGNPPLILPAVPAEKHRSSGKALVTALIILGIVTVFILFLFVFFIMSRLFRLYDEVGAPRPIGPYFALVFLAIYPVASFFEAFYIGKKIKLVGQLTNRQELAGLLLLIVGGFVFFGLGIGLLVLTTIMPIYNLTAHF